MCVRCVAPSWGVFGQNESNASESEGAIISLVVLVTSHDVLAQDTMEADQGVPFRNLLRVPSANGVASDKFDKWPVFDTIMELNASNLDLFSSRLIPGRLSLDGEIDANDALACDASDVLGRALADQGIRVIRVRVKHGRAHSIR
mmetsp:Transcript_27732/g.37037  ORF Transcript_27732/g.37037 Transcript_27732/m.37037 type:complete len:145 (+) Transcript_27732:45-479(+)